MSALQVFLVEDSPTIRQNLAAALEELAPVEVVGWADDAAGALSALLRQPPPCDLVIVDIFLRGGSGLDVLRALQRAASPVRRVVLTNYGAPQLRDDCLALGAEHVFDKSGDVEALAAYCDALAAGRG
jgi:DNA-binding NarL/FixJ family response regulator